MKYKFNIITDVNGLDQCSPKPCQSPYSKYVIALASWKDVIPEIDFLEQKKYQKVDIVKYKDYPLFSEILPTLEKIEESLMKSKIQRKNAQKTISCT